MIVDLYIIIIFKYLRLYIYNLLRVIVLYALYYKKDMILLFVITL